MALNHETCIDLLRKIWQTLDILPFQNNMFSLFLSCTTYTPISVLTIYIKIYTGLLLNSTWTIP